MLAPLQRRIQVQSPYPYNGISVQGKNIVIGVMDPHNTICTSFFLFFFVYIFHMYMYIVYAVIVLTEQYRDAFILL